MLVTHFLHPRLLLDETQRRKIVQHLAARSILDVRQRRSFLHRPHLFERQRIALDRGRRMGVARPRILLQGRNPRDLHGRIQDASPQTAIASTRVSSGGVIVNCGSQRMRASLAAVGRKSSISQVLVNQKSSGSIESPVPVHRRTAQLRRTALHPQLAGGQPR